MASSYSMSPILALAIAGGCALADDGASDARAVEPVLREMYDEFRHSDVRYFSGAVDLDDDGRDEVIVHVVSPMLCGTGGCNTLVFILGEAGYELVSDISVNRPPIRVAERRTNGWRNLIVHVSGGGLAPHAVELRFDGSSYPSNATVPPAEPVASTAGSTIVIGGFENFTEGTPLFRD